MSDLPDDYTRRQLVELLTDLEEHGVPEQKAYRELQTAAGKLPYMSYAEVREDLGAPPADAVEGGPLED